MLCACIIRHLFLAFHFAFVSFTSFCISFCIASLLLKCKCKYASIQVETTIRTSILHFGLKNFLEDAIIIKLKRMKFTLSGWICWWSLWWFYRHRFCALRLYFSIVVLFSSKLIKSFAGINCYTCNNNTIIIVINEPN